MKNTLTYKELKQWYTENEQARQTAKKVFGKTQPNIYQTGFYSAPSWNWGYQIGICTVKVSTDLGNGDMETVMQPFEVVTQFGEVKAARKIYIPTVYIPTEEAKS